MSNCSGGQGLFPRVLELQLIDDDNDDDIGVSKKYTSDQGTIVLGRGSRHDGTVSEPSSGRFRDFHGNRTAVMSSKHATITWQSHEFCFLTDTGSTNGTYILRHGDQISVRARVGVSYRISDGDVVTFGREIPGGRSSTNQCIPLPFRVQLRKIPAPHANVSFASTSAISQPLVRPGRVTTALEHGFAGTRSRHDDDDVDSGFGSSPEKNQEASGRSNFYRVERGTRRYGLSDQDVLQSDEDDKNDDDQESVMILDDQDKSQISSPEPGDQKHRPFSDASVHDHDHDQCGCSHWSPRCSSEEFEHELDRHDHNASNSDHSQQGLYSDLEEFSDHSVFGSDIEEAEEEPDFDFKSDPELDRVVSQLRTHVDAVCSRDASHEIDDQASVSMVSAIDVESSKDIASSKEPAVIRHEEPQSIIEPVVQGIDKVVEVEEDNRNMGRSSTPHKKVTQEISLATPGHSPTTRASQEPAVDAEGAGHAENRDSAFPLGNDEPGTRQRTRNNPHISFSWDLAPFPSTHLLDFEDLERSAALEGKTRVQTDQDAASQTSHLPSPEESGSDAEGQEAENHHEVYDVQVEPSDKARPEDDDELEAFYDNFYGDEHWPADVGKKRDDSKLSVLTTGTNKKTVTASTSVVEGAQASMARDSRLNLPHSMTEAATLETSKLMSDLGHSLDGVDDQLNILDATLSSLQIQLDRLEKSTPFSRDSTFPLPAYTRVQNARHVLADLKRQVDASKQVIIQSKNGADLISVKAQPIHRPEAQVALDGPSPDIPDNAVGSQEPQSPGAAFAEDEDLDAVDQDVDGDLRDTLMHDTTDGQLFDGGEEYWYDEVDAVAPDSDDDSCARSSEGATDSHELTRDSLIATDTASNSTGKRVFSTTDMAKDDDAAATALDTAERLEDVLAPRLVAPLPKRRRLVRDIAIVGVGFGAGVVACIAGLSAFSDAILALDA